MSIMLYRRQKKTINVKLICPNFSPSRVYIYIPHIEIYEMDKMKV